MSKAKQYRKRPVVIEAIEFTGDNKVDVLSFIVGGNVFVTDNSSMGGGDIFRQTYEAVE